MLDLGLLGQVSDTALTDDKALAFEKSGLPNTFVPGRNLIFVTFAAAIADATSACRLQNRRDALT